MPMVAVLILSQFKQPLLIKEVTDGYFKEKADEETN